jgi:hypothetical protein
MKKDFDEVIFNLFIMAFRYPKFFPYISKSDYEIILQTNQFATLKDCFPENEICKQELLVHKGEVFWAQVNYIIED